MVDHKHLIIRAEVKTPFVDPQKTKEWLVRLVESIGMNITVSGGPHVDYVDVPGNSGIAGIVMIETSHASIHVWDKADPPLVQMDVYSCKDYNPLVVLSMLREMHPTKIESILIDRADMKQVQIEIDPALLEL